ncbi:hypothetical protein SASPL_114087 [Salvia splendens]|uniref:Uncharacterized protein n=1 Tax=Salvia splendens TaxID=180675 RepID=A0A8X8Y167_SALSN|nr:hypothetical protein SASPL_114087 [Salvia splendens]
MDAFLKSYFPSLLLRKWMEDSSEDQYCRLDSLLLSMFTSSLYLAALSSSVVASTLTRKVGRKTTMVGGGVLFFVGALINDFSFSMDAYFCPTLHGFGVGFSIQEGLSSLPQPSRDTEFHDRARPEPSSGGFVDQEFNDIVKAIVFICIFVGGFGWSWGPLAWLVPSEIFRLEIRMSRSIWAAPFLSLKPS